MEHSFDRFLWDNNLSKDISCETHHYGHHNEHLFYLVNVYFSNSYTDQICDYNRGDTYADCSKGSIYNAFKNSSNFWRFKDSSSQITFNYHGNFIFLDEDGIEFVEGKRKLEKAGFQIVFSNGNFFDGYGSGIGIFTNSYDGHYAYLKNLDNIYRNTQNLIEINTILDANIRELNSITSGITTVFRFPGSLEDKREYVQKISSFNISFIEDYRETSIILEKLYTDANILADSVSSNYFGIYYQDVSDEYLNGLRIELDILNAKLERIEGKNVMFEDNLKSTLIALQNLIDNKESQKSSNVALVITLVLTIVVLLATLSMNVIQGISDKTSSKKVRNETIFGLALFYLISLVVIILINGDVVDFGGIIYIFTSFLFLYVMYMFYRITKLLMIHRD